MKAVDTNVVVRLVMGDHPEQAEIAERTFARPVLLPLTVLLETVWVLTSRYGLSRAETADVLGNLLDRSTVRVEAEPQIRWALERYATQGVIADLIHIVAARSASGFATFDAGIAAAVGPDAPVPIELLD